MVSSKVIKDAASVILIRDGRTSPEVFMLERPGRGIFPNLRVFPGGKVDEEDHEIASKYPTTLSHIPWGTAPPLHFAVTAVRECFEEAGVLFTRQNTGELKQDGSDGASRETLMTSEQTFAQVLETGSSEIDFSNLHYFSHWITPAHAPARFNTFFFVARIPSLQSASHHHAETTDGNWVTPRQALKNYATGEWQMIIPTITTLRMISGYQSTSHLIETIQAGAHRIPITASLNAQGMQFYESTR